MDRRLLRRPLLPITGEGTFGVTSLKNRYGSAATPGQRMERTGPMKSAPIPFTLTANEAFNVAAANPDRAGLLLQNADPANNLYYNFGSVASLQSFSLVPGQYILLDFVCPTDAVWVFAAFNLSGMYTEFAREAALS